ncbi:MAG: beta-propeller fold lactonase family protein [Limisphaerales bacterium]
MNTFGPIISIRRVAGGVVVALGWLIHGLAADPAMAAGPIVISGNEAKIDLTSGAGRRIVPEGPDSLTILDFGTFPPKVTHVMDVPNTVIGPPSNIAITPDGALALVANSLRMDPEDSTNWFPETFVHVVDLASQPPRVMGRVETGRQPSGISITGDGRVALVANRASGTISVLRVRGANVESVGEVLVCDPADSLSDVAVSPDGRRVLASVQKGGYLALLDLDGERLTLTGRQFSVYGQPYRVVITPDGALGLTAGAGTGNGLDRDALSVVDLEADPIRTTDFVPLGSVPESIEVSPNGRLVAAVLMEGSNLAETHRDHSKEGRLVILERRGRTYRLASEHAIGRIPEGVAFTGDGRHLVVQCHPDRELRIFSVRGSRVRDTGKRVAVPGFPSSLRASP